jgi:hypothetical protein
MAEKPEFITGIARPSKSMRRAMQAIHGIGAVKKMDEVIDDSIAVDSFAKLLDQTIELKRNKTTGVVNMKDVAAHILIVMKSNQKG